MYEKDLNFYVECVELISAYAFISDVAEILKKIMALIDALKQDSLHNIESLTKDTLCSVDFEHEGITIQYTNKKHINTVTRIKSDCIYIIGKLILLAFKKIAEHELEKQLNLSDKLSTIYKMLKLALERKKSQN